MPQNLRLQWSSGLPGPDTYLIQESAELQQELAADWTAINRLTERTWFTRLWVYQETHLATRAEVVVGSARLLESLLSRDSLDSFCCGQSAAEHHYKNLQSFGSSDLG